MRHGVFVLTPVVYFLSHKTAYEMRISDWSSDVCSSDLLGHDLVLRLLVAGQEILGPFPRAHEIEAAEFLHQPHRLVDHALLVVVVAHRSEESRVGKEWVSTCRARWSPCTRTKTQT